MAEPSTTNKGLIAPNTGDLVGTWGSAAVNPNWVALDGMLGGFATFSLSSATTVLLTTPTGTASPGAGPTQSQNALLRFTGTLTGNSVFQFSLPGFYIVENLCTVGSFYVQLAPALGTGNTIGAIPGKKCHVFYDGTNMDFVDLPDPGTYLDLAVATTPSWYGACTVQPYLICNGSIYTSTLYPNLALVLGSTFGGNGSSTFGVPDLQGRYRIPIDTEGTRITSAGSGINGAALGASGGSQLLQAHTHTYSDPGHSHLVGFTQALQGFGTLNEVNFVTSPLQVETSTSTINIAIGTAGSGASGNIPPALVAGLTLIKT
jgi:microcystin-dependent protein